MMKNGENTNINIRYLVTYHRKKQDITMYCKYIIVKKI